MTRSTLVVMAATAAVSSLGTAALTGTLGAGAPASAAAGDTRIVRELRLLNAAVGQRQEPPPHDVMDLLGQICRNTLPQDGLRSSC